MGGGGSMTDHELLLAISDIVEKKINAAVGPVEINMKMMEGSIRQDMKEMEAGIRRDMSVLDDRITGLDHRVTDLNDQVLKLSDRVLNVELHLEQVTDPKIEWLAENYLPAAKRYEKATEKIEAVASDVDVLKSVVREHSEKLQMIS